MPPLNEALIDPNNIDKTAIWLDSTNSEFNPKPILPLAIFAGAGAGLYIENLVNEKFVTNHRYEAGIGHINQIESNRANYINSVQTQLDNGITLPAEIVTNKIISYSTEIEHVKQKLPSGYQPHIEGIADFTSFIATGIFVGAALYKTVKRYSNRGRSRIEALNTQ